MRVIRYNLGPLDNNTYLLVDEASNEAAIIDPTFGSRFIWSEIENMGLQLRYVLNTHAHIDHVVENAYFAQMSGAPVAMHPNDIPLLEAMDRQALWLGTEPPERVDPQLLLNHGTSLALGNAAIRIVLTPGHSPGHVAFLGHEFALSGDLLFCGSIGRSDLPGGNQEQLLHSIHSELLSLPDSTTVYPGHGDVTTIGTERLSNPFLHP